MKKPITIRFVRVVETRWEAPEEFKEDEIPTMKFVMTIEYSEGVLKERREFSWDITESTVHRKHYSNIYALCKIFKAPNPKRLESLVLVALESDFGKDNPSVFALGRKDGAELVILPWLQDSKTWCEKQILDLAEVVKTIETFFEKNGTSD